MTSGILNCQRKIELLLSEFLRGGLDLRVVLGVLDLLLDTVFNLLLELGGEGGETFFQGIAKDSRFLGSGRTLTLGVQGALLLGRGLLFLGFCFLRLDFFCGFDFSFF